MFLIAPFSFFWTRFLIFLFLKFSTAVVDLLLLFTWECWLLSVLWTLLHSVSIMKFWIWSCSSLSTKSRVVFLPTEQLVSKLMKRPVIASKNVTPASCPDMTFALSEQVIEDTTKIVFPALVTCLISLSMLWSELSFSNTDPALYFFLFKYGISVHLNSLSYWD